MKTTQIPLPNPGSMQAQKEGCKCPIMDNHYGEGVPGYKEPAFYTTQNCPLHGFAVEHNHKAPERTPTVG